MTTNQEALEQRARELMPEQWELDCQGKQDFDSDLLALSCRYYPPNYDNGARHSVNASIVWGEGTNSPLTEILLKANSEAEAKAMAEDWALDETRKIIAALTDTIAAQGGVVEELKRLRESDAKWREEWQASLGLDGIVVHGTRKAIDRLAAHVQQRPQPSASVEQREDSICTPVSPEEEESIDLAAGVAKVVLHLPINLLGVIDNRASQQGVVRNAYLREHLAVTHSSIQSTPAAMGELPELPRSYGEHCVYDSVRVMREPGYTADQMRAYGQACALSARTAPVEGGGTRCPTCSAPVVKTEVAGAFEIRDEYRYAGDSAQAFVNLGDSEANFIADGERLNCPACGGSGHVDDATTAPVVGDELASLYDAAAKGFHVTESCGPDAKYWHVSKFRSMQDLHRFHEKWTAAMVFARDTARTVSRGDCNE